MKVAPKKRLGQHFLTNVQVCERIAECLPPFEQPMSVLEIGPGTGAITKYFVQREDIDFCAFEVDKESITYLHAQYPSLREKVFFQDFLKADLAGFFKHKPFCVVGNFPYNISSQILFKCLEHRNQIPLIIGMFQKEVAVRIAEKPGSKSYGILSVLLQSYYDIEYCFTVEPGAFYPPPKVKSGVIRCTRNQRANLGCDEKLFVQVVKMAFNQRRKTLRNSLRQLIEHVKLDEKYDKARPEQLAVEDFIYLTKQIERYNEQKSE
jgi:16S rRNA (adenine1518-N6/adenine1519-N6)-dimethyltransferase